MSFNKMNDKNTKCRMIINAFENFDLYYHAIICEYVPIEKSDLKIWNGIITKIDWCNIDCEPIYKNEVIMSSLFNLMNK